MILRRKEDSKNQLNTDWCGTEGTREKYLGARIPSCWPVLWPFCSRETYWKKATPFSLRSYCYEKSSHADGWRTNLEDVPAVSKDPIVQIAYSVSTKSQPIKTFVENSKKADNADTEKEK